MTEATPTDAGAEIAALQRQVAALADFVTTITAAIVSDRPLARLIVEALMMDKGTLPSFQGDRGQTSQITTTSLADTVLTIAGHRPMPVPIRLVHDADGPQVEG